MEEAPASANKFAVSLSSVKMYLRFLSISRIPPACLFRIERKTNFHCHARRDRMARRSWYIFRGTGRVLRRCRIADPWYFRESSAPRIRATVSVSHGWRSIPRGDFASWITIWSDGWRFVVSFADRWIAGRMASEVPSARVSVDSVPIYLPQLFQSFPSRIVENSLGGFGRVNSRASTRNCFLVAGGRRTDGVAQCASPSREIVFPRAGFWT